MTLKRWLENKWLTEHRTSPQEVRELLELVDRDIKDASAKSISTDWRLAIAYNAVLQCAKVGLAAAGYRPARGAAQHYYTIESMRFTIGLDEDDIRTIDAFRKKRNVSDYQRAGSVSDTETDELLTIAQAVRQKTLTWLRSKHPNLVGKR